MSTRQSSDITPSDSSELLSAEEAGRQALAMRIFSAVRKPMSSPKYAALLVVLALVFGLASWGIIRGVNALGNDAKSSDKAVEAGKDNATIIYFSAADAKEIRHATVTLTKSEKNSEAVVEIPFPRITLEGNYALHIYAPTTVSQDARCSLRLERPDVNNISEYYHPNNLTVADFCPSVDDGSVDFWVPIVRTDRRLDNRPSQLIIRGVGATLNLDLIELEEASPVDWDGATAFQGTGPAFIRTTSGGNAFTFNVSDAFRATVYSNQTLNYFARSDIEFNKYNIHPKDSFKYLDGTSESTTGYIFVFPFSPYMHVPWTLTQVDTGDFSAR